MARLNALRKNLPPNATESVVEEYNALVHELQVSSRDEGLVAFRIPDNRLEHLITGSSRPTARRPSGSVSYSDERYCDDDYFKRQVEGLWGYLAERSTMMTSKQRTYWDMNDDELETLAIGLKIPYVNISPDGSWHINRTVIIDELVKRDKYLRDMNPQSSSITVHGSVYNSNLQQGDGLTATINYKAMESDVLRVLAGIERSIDDLGLSQADKGELVADVGTVKAQLNSPNPKTSVITECFRSIRHVLEHAGGAAMAHGLVAEVVRLLSHH